MAMETETFRGALEVHDKLFKLCGNQCNKSVNRCGREEGREKRGEVLMSFFTACVVKFL
jgi:hypothetical protein